MRCLVTGGNGFVGSHLVEALVERGDEVVCLARRTSDLRWVDESRVTVTHGDVTDLASLVRAVEGAEVVFHLAGMLRGRDYAAYYRVNAEGARNVAVACRDADGAPPRLVHCSSQAAGGPSVDGRRRQEGEPPAPVSDYGRSKLEGERAVVDAARGDVPFVIVRPPAVYGPRDTDICMYFRLISRGIALFVGDGRQKFDLVYVTDLVTAFLLVADNPAALGSVYYVNDGDEHTWRSMSAAVASAVGTRPLRVPIPMPLMSAVARVVECVAAVRETAPVLHRQKIAEFRQPAWKCDASRIRGELGFEPAFNVERGMRETARWYREQGWI